MMVRREIAEKPGEGQVAQGGRKNISSGRPSPLAHASCSNIGDCGRSVHE